MDCSSDDFSKELGWEIVFNLLYPMAFISSFWSRQPVAAPPPQGNN